MNVIRFFALVFILQFFTVQIALGQDKESLILAYLRGHNSDSLWIKRLNVLRHNLIQGGEVSEKDLLNFAALTLFRFAYFDGVRGNSIETYNVLYGRDKLKIQQTPMFIYDVVNDLPLRAKFDWSFMTQETLRDYGPSKPTEFYDTFEIPTGYLTQVWEEIRNNPEAAVLPCTPLASQAFQSSPIQQRSFVRKPVCFLPTVPARDLGNHQQVLEDIINRSTKRISLSSISSCSEACNKVLMAHAYYRKSSAKNESNIERAFTLFKGTRYITFLPERHWENHPDTLIYIEELVDGLIESKDKIFIESSNRYSGASAHLLSLEEYWRSFRDKNYNGILGILLKSPNVSYRSLRELETGEMPKEHAQYIALLERMGASGAIQQLDMGMDFSLQETFQLACTVRSTTQANTIDQNAPMGHSWAIGGSRHASEVKQELISKGWIEVDLY